MYTMFPVFSLVLDEDVPSDIALIYPELYKDLGKVGHTKLQSTSAHLCWCSVDVNEYFPC